jgi:hypothetical protein
VVGVAALGKHGAGDLVAAKEDTQFFEVAVSAAVTPAIPPVGCFY